MTTKKYVVTLNNKEDLNDFYNDMESASSKSNIPDRTCNCNLRRNISRNTVYDLTDEEAALLKQDSRVKDVDLTFEDKGLEIVNYGWSETAVFAKNPTTVAHRSWALKRIIDGEQTANWGKDFDSSNTNQFYNTSSTTVSTTSSGKNVDIIIAEDDLHQSALSSFREFWTVQPNGSLAYIPRIKYFNWFAYNSDLGLTNNADTTYGQINSLGGDDHAYKVAVVAAGNSAGWARDANVFSIRTKGSSQLTGITWVETFVDYIRHFHKNKPINPATGKRNPTIVNMSWGVVDSNISNLTSGSYKGITYSAIRKVEVPSYDGNNIVTHSNGDTRYFSVLPQTFQSDQPANYYLSTDSNFSISGFHSISDVLDGTWDQYSLNRNGWGMTDILSDKSFDFTCNVFGSSLSYLGHFSYNKDSLQARNSALDADIADAIADGVIFVAAAGNSGFQRSRNVDNYVNQDRMNGLYGDIGSVTYSAKVTYINGSNNNYTYEYNKGGSPNQTDDVICVGGVHTVINDTGNTSLESMSALSNYGERIDVNAPSFYIWTHQYSGSGANAVDGSNRRYYRIVQGTSYAAPQVTGVLACLLEQEPNLTQAEALQHLTENCKYGQLSKGSADGYQVSTYNVSGNQRYFKDGHRKNYSTNAISAFATVTGNTINKYLAYKKKREESGSIYPRNNFKNRNVKVKTAHSLVGTIGITNNTDFYNSTDADTVFIRENNIFDSVRGHLTSSPKYPRVNLRVTKAYS